MLNLNHSRTSIVHKSVLSLTVLTALSACSSTQKTSGQGMVSVIAQNVVRVAGAKAVRDLTLSELKGQKTHVQISGFVDEFNKGFINNLISAQVEDAGGRLVDRSNADFLVEIGVNAAGNDNGRSDYFVGSAERTEGSVDLTVVLRKAATGERMSSQTIRG